MATQKFNGSDYLLLLLYLDNKSPIKGAVRLEKMMFLFNEEIANVLRNKGLDSYNLPTFIAYNYGPFSKDVYMQVDFFSSIGFVKITNVYSNEDLAEVDEWEEGYFIDELWADESSIVIPDNKYYIYRITELGSQYVESNILQEIKDDQLAFLNKFKKQIVKISIDSLLKYVYEKYPEYAEKSLIKDEVLGSE